jgi:hypothetical protein
VSDSCGCGVPSLTRGRNCRLQLLLTFTSEVPWDSWPYFALRFKTPPILRPKSPYFRPPRIRWPSYTLRHWVAFRRLLRLSGLGRGHSNSPPQGCSHWLTARYKTSAHTSQKHRVSVTVQLLPRKYACLQIRYLATDVHATLTVWTLSRLTKASWTSSINGI